jgi:truncated hemoglobin YjbI
MKKYRVRTHHWNEDGELSTLDRWLGDLQDAIDHAIDSLCDRFKIYDEDGNLIESSNDTDDNSYS